MPPKIYTAATHPNHKLIKALVKAGHKNIVVSYSPAWPGPGGWSYTSDQGYKRLHLDIPCSLKMIEKGMDIGQYNASVMKNL